MPYQPWLLFERYIYICIFFIWEINASKNFQNKFSISLNITQKMKLTIRDCFSKCERVHRKLSISSCLLKKSWMENFAISCRVNFAKRFSFLHYFDHHISVQVTFEHQNCWPSFCYLSRVRSFWIALIWWLWKFNSIEFIRYTKLAKYVFLEDCNNYDWKSMEECM